MRVVLDTNVVVSGAFFGAAPRAVLGAWLDGRLLLTHLAAQGLLVPDSEVRERITADPDDDKFMRCAYVAGAVVVSGDRHLIAADGWNGIRVQTPSALLASLADENLGAT